MLDVLAPRLDQEWLALLEAAGAVLNRERTVESIDELPLWRDAPAEPLDAPWPAAP